jgi:RNA polymerase sigma-70 factor (sigma-E family)
MTFEDFAAERLPGLLRFAAVLTGDRTQAEDLAQEVLVKAHARWNSIGSLDRPEAYVRKMLLNEFLSWRRRSWRLVPAGSGSDVDRRHSPDHAAGYAERDALIAELGKLPPRQRAVLALRYYEGFSDTEIAAALGCSAGTIRGYASRALAALRVEMAERPYGAAGVAAPGFAAPAVAVRAAAVRAGAVRAGAVRAGAKETR